MSIYKKLLEVQKEVGAVSKDSTNPFFKSKYFDINKLVEHVQPIISKHGLVLIQPIRDNHVFSIIIDSESGDSEASCLQLPESNDPQKLGSAITYYRRYTLSSLLGLQAEDDDANSVSGNNSKPFLVKDSENWNNVKKAILEGYSIEQIKGKYQLKKEVEDELKGLIK